MSFEDINQEALGRRAPANFNHARQKKTESNFGGGNVVQRNAGTPCGSGFALRVTYYYRCFFTSVSMKMTCRYPLCNVSLTNPRVRMFFVILAGKLSSTLTLQSNTLSPLTCQLKLFNDGEQSSTWLVFDNFLFHCVTVSVILNFYTTLPVIFFSFTEQFRKRRERRNEKWV